MTCLLGKIWVARTEGSMPHSRLGTQQQQSIGMLTAKSTASALRLNLFKAIWRHSTTSTGCLCSIETLSQSKPLLSTMLLNCQPLASTHARCHSVAAAQAPGSTYTNIFLCDIPRILCAYQSRAPYPCQSARIVDCRHQWRTLAEVIIAQGCARVVGEKMPT
jgi:hypothetical protein